MKTFLILAIALLSCLQSNCQPFQEHMIWENRTRKFITFLPEDYNRDEPLPLVINMHPFLTDGPFQMWYTKFNWLANREKIIVVYPYGIQGRWNSGSFFGIEQPVDDLGFLSALIDYMAVLYNIDTRKVYSTGYSAGGYMSHKLACDMTNRIAAIAPVSASMNPDLMDVCNPLRPMPVMIFNGTADAIVEYNGSPVSASVDDILELWASLDGCDPVPTEEELPNISTTDNTTTTKYSYTNCADNSEVILHKIFGGGHTWPGRNFPLLGNTSQDIKANDEIWDFFKRHEIPDDVACQRPTGMIVDYDGNTASLSWDPIPGIDFYSLMHILPGGELQLVANISDPFIDLPSTMDGELVWMVRAQCESGHVSWSEINNDDITARLSSGRLVMITYPNPASERVTVEFEKDHLPVSISIFNAYGHSIRTLTVTDQTMSIDISELDNGIFHIVANGQAYSAETVRKW